jgi:O-antigen ligase
VKYVAVFFALALIARNNIYFSGPFEVLRGFGLLLVAIMGFYGILQPKVIKAVGHYWPQIGYLSVAMLSIATTEYPAFVAFHTLSLAGVVMFSIACAESAKSNAIRSSILSATFFGYLLLISLSLILKLINPSLVYEVLYAGELRFRGIFPKAGIMGASSGVLLGLCLFWRSKRKSIRWMALVPALACLLLTQSRTFWVAAFVAGLATYLRYSRHAPKFVLAGAFFALILGAGAYVADVKLKGDSLRKFTRVESVTNLTGRVQLWAAALEKVLQQPVLGLGLSAGSSAFEDRQNVVGLGGDKDELDAARSMGRTTMHSGYMQSLLDLGFIGTFFYLSIIGSALWSVYRYDALRQYPTEFYLLIFLSVANISENVIYAVTVFNSVLFFMLAAFAMHLRRPEALAEPVERKGGTGRREPHPALYRPKAELT